MKNYDIKVENFDFRQISGYQNYLENININNSSNLIVVDNHLPEITKRFVTAYLFSSYQLNGCVDKEYFDHLYYESIYDGQIYNYALDLLMPDLIFDCESEQIKDTSMLAQRYKISEFLVSEKQKEKKKIN